MLMGENGTRNSTMKNGVTKTEDVLTVTGKKVGIKISGRNAENKKENKKN